ncbi:MAG: choice-of-anchor E domain-containing protein [Armatimonadetes bacterium]|nr:choice-of-anchor E domain-containing protein [Armatimonadota bacterium]
MRLRTAALTAALIAVAQLSTAWADLSTVWVERDFNSTASNVSVAVPMFDTDGGRFWLTSVTISIYEDSYGYFAVENESRGNHQWIVNPREVRAWDLSGPGLAATSNTAWDGDPAMLLDRDTPGPPEPPDYQPPDGYTWGRVGYSGADRGSTSVGSSYFSQYQASGGGTTDFTLNVTTIEKLLNWVTGPPPQWSEQITDGNPNLRIHLRVDYEWDAVPERGTWVLMVLGLGGLVAWTRHRRLRAATPAGSQDPRQVA